MSASSKAIILKAIKYGETSLIIHAYTKEYGKLAFIVKGARKAKAKIQANIIQPLSIVELDFKHSTRKDLHFLNEVRVTHIFHSIPSDMAKTAMAMYLLEIVNKSIQSGMENEALFNFIHDFLIALDVHQAYKNWHYFILLECSKYFGFYHNNNYSQEKCYFDPNLGIFSILEAFGYQVDDQLSLILSKLLFESLETIDSVEISKVQRQQLLKELERFYAIHVPNFGEIKSLEVYRQVFS